MPYELQGVGRGAVKEGAERPAREKPRRLGRRRARRRRDERVGVRGADELCVWLRLLLYLDLVTVIFVHLLCCPTLHCQVDSGGLAPLPATR
jgi:hypothetical protein